MTNKTYIELEDLNLTNMEKTLCIEALNKTKTMTEAAKLLGITRSSLKRRILWYDINITKIVK